MYCFVVFNNYCILSLFFLTFDLSDLESQLLFLISICFFFVLFSLIFIFICINHIYVTWSSRMSRKSVATCYWFQKFYFLSTYVKVNVKKKSRSLWFRWFFSVVSTFQCDFQCHILVVLVCYVDWKLELFSSRYHNLNHGVVLRDMKPSSNRTGLPLTQLLKQLVWYITDCSLK